jgi:hypothetical protein
MNTVADQFTDTLAAAGVKGIDGIIGDSPNGLTDARHRQVKIGWMHVRHGEIAVLPAGAGAELAGAHDGPFPVDAVVKRTGLAMLPFVTLEMATGFARFMLKALTRGRADEFSDRACLNLWRWRERSMDAAAPGITSRRLQLGHGTSATPRRE